VGLVVSIGSAAPNLIGMNMPSCLDWEGSDVFADAFRTAREWDKISGGDASVDANGWPQEDAMAVCWHGAAHMAGTYKLEFDGRANITIEWTGGSVTGKTYNAAQDLTVAFVTVSDPTQLRMRFTSTSNGVRNVRLWRPGYHDGTRTFTDRFKNLLPRFAVLRFMDWTATNWNQDKQWGDRVRPEQYRASLPRVDYGWQGRGHPWEYAIQLCNEVQRDIWVCLPVRADDNYVRNLALLLRDGTNGFAGLSTNLKIYVEFSNEVWNYGFEQASYNRAQAIAEVNAGGSPLNFDGNANTYYWGWRRVAKRGAEISVIFREVFGDGAMMTRVRPMLMTQLNNGQDTHTQVYKFMDEYLNNPDYVAEPHPPSYYFYGSGGTDYYSPDNSSNDLTLDNIWTSRHFDVQVHIPVLENDAKYPVAFGLKRICYEGGPGLDQNGHSEATKAAAVNDPRMRAKVIQQHEAWSAHGGDLLVYFTLIGNFQWGFTPDVLDTNTYKLQAIDHLNATSAASVVYGRLLPATIPGNDYDCSWISWQSPSTGTRTFENRNWAGYVTRVDTPGLYRYTVRAGAAGNAARIEMLVDGKAGGMIDMPNTGSLNTTTNLVVANVVHGAGVHGFKISGRGDSVRVHEITVELVPEPAAASVLAFAVAVVIGARCARHSHQALS
jgi:hypothetical protein